MKTLIIAEKPSVAGDIARALGGFKREKDYFENESYVVSSAVGHLLEITPPEGVEVKRGKWSLTNLPVLPDHFDLVPIKASQERLKVLTRLYKRKDINGVINACDAGREGELIFYNLLRHLRDENKNAKSKEDVPVRRLWLQSMTPASIRRGFEQLRNNDEVENLRRAAVCRNEADWLVGINSTRAMTALHSTGGGFFKTTVGRVQTPTLAILVERERQIDQFTSRPYWEVHADFTVAAGEYSGTWQHDKTTIAANKGDKEFRPERIFDLQKAEEIFAACKGKSGRASETVKPSSEISPMLFDLTSLQREANSRFGMSARGVLATAQSLYEKHKMITYPRTDSRYLPQDYPAVARKTLQAFSKDSNLGKFADKALKENWVAPANRRIFNDAKVSDHFAIIPTGENIGKAAQLRDNERKIYDFICRRFIAVFFPPAKYLVTERRTLVGEHCFLTKGKVLQEAGWRAVMAQTTGDTDLVPLNVDAEGGEDAAIADIRKEEKATKPPPRYSEATLLSAMEGAGKLVEDEELRDAMSERGLGTPATRAATIEGLVNERYIIRDRRDLIPTPKARSLMRLLAYLKVEALTQPALTGEWEYKLRRIEKAEADDKTFMQEIRNLTNTIVDAAKNCGDVQNLESDDFVTLSAPCPQCGGAVAERHRRYNCTKCEFFIWKTIAGREFSVNEVETLIATGSTGELEGFRSRLGREFAAEVKMKKGEDGKMQAAFAFEEQTKMQDISSEEIAEKDIIGPCPKCGGNVRDSGSKYFCERAVGDAPKCDFTFGAAILQRKIAPHELQQLLNEGKTALLEKFISRKTGRPFSAHLTMDLAQKDGKLQFEFAPRPAKPAKKTARKTGTK